MVSVLNRLVFSFLIKKRLAQWLERIPVRLTTKLSMNKAENLIINKSDASSDVKGLRSQSFTALFPDLYSNPNCKYFLGYGYLVFNSEGMGMSSVLLSVLFGVILINVCYNVSSIWSASLSRIESRATDLSAL